MRFFTAFLFLITLWPQIQAQIAYQMAGPYEVIARDGEYRHTKAGSERDMRAALDFALKGDTANALRIVNAYATTLKHIEGHDAPLCLIQCYDMVRAMIVCGEKSEKGDQLIRRVFIPVIEKFEADSPYANGNWGAIVNRCRMACAIALKDSVLYQASREYFLHGFDNGSFPH